MIRTVTTLLTLATLLTVPTVAPAQTPLKPGLLAAPTVTAAQVTLTWVSAGQLAGTHYRVLRDGLALGETPPDTLTYTDTTVQPSRGYLYAVQAVLGSAQSAVSIALAVMTPAAVVPPPPAAGDTVPPSTPTGLRAAATWDKVELFWDASTDNVGVEGYMVARNGQLLTEIAAPPLHDSQFATGNVYTYAVQALDAAGNRSATSTPLTVTIPEPPPGPVVPAPPPITSVILSVEGLPVPLVCLPAGPAASPPQ